MRNGYFDYERAVRNKTYGRYDCNGHSGASSSEGRTIRLVTAIGAWGDTFASIGNAFAVAEKPLRVVCYGFDSKIADWLRLQPFVEKVWWVCPRSKADYDDFIEASCGSDLPLESWAPELLRGTGLRPEQLCVTHVDYFMHENPEVNHWHDAFLPYEIRKSASDLISLLREQYGQPVYLLQPRSEQSCPWHDHWPWWYEGIEWLLENTPYIYLLVGQQWTGKQEYPRLLNWIGKTGSMMEVLALAEAADGLVTTCNALSLWSVIQRIPALVCNNAAMLNLGCFFRRWITAPNNHIVELPQDMSVFIERFKQYELRDRKWEPSSPGIQALRHKPRAAGSGLLLPHVAGSSSRQLV